MPVAAAIAGAAVIGGATSIISANKAAKTAKKVAASNNALQTDIYNQNKATLSPFVQQGSNVTPIINGALGLGDAAAASKAFDTFRGSDGYQFRTNEGLKGVQAALGARGFMDSGAAQKSLLNYSQGAASNEFGNWLSALTGQQGVGLTAASAQAGVGQGYANNISANNNNAANTSANAALSVAGSINGALNNGVSAYGMSQGLKSSYGGASQPALGGNPSVDYWAGMMP